VCRTLMKLSPGVIIHGRHADISVQCSKKQLSLTVKQTDVMYNWAIFSSNIYYLIWNVGIKWGLAKISEVHTKLKNSRNVRWCEITDTAQNISPAEVHQELS